MWVGLILSVEELSRKRMISQKNKNKNISANRLPLAKCNSSESFLPVCSASRKSWVVPSRNQVFTSTVHLLKYLFFPLPAGRMRPQSTKICWDVARVRGKPKLESSTPEWGVCYGRSRCQAPPQGQGLSATLESHTYVLVNGTVNISCRL